MAASGLLYCLLNASLRSISLRLHPFQVLALVYGATIVLMLLPVLVTRPAQRMPRSLGGLIARGGVHWVGMCMWLFGITQVTLAEATAINFATPLLIMAGAALLLREPMRWHRWVATLGGFAGVLVAVGPRLTTSNRGYALLLLASSGVFALSFLLTKRLTRSEGPWVIVFWQSLVVMTLSIPLAAFYWRIPSALDWLTSLLAGMLAVAGNYCLARSFASGDISASQPAKFLDLIWASALGWWIFGDAVHDSILLGGMIIIFSTAWISRREAER